MDDYRKADPLALAIGNYIQLELLKRRAKQWAEEKTDDQAEREKAFGRHLTEDVVCGIRCYTELIVECLEFPTWMEAVASYNEAVSRYEGNCNSSLSVKQFRKIAKELAKEEL